jgi:hypothetical protein
MYYPQQVLTVRSICAVLCLSAIVAACATTPMPVDRIALAQSQIQRAERADADELAPIPLQSARSKLASALASPHSSAGALAARRLADEAQADARVAEASAQAAQSERAAAELDKTLDALRTETTRGASNN